MFQTLRLTDYVLFDRLDMEFGPGLTVISGETGAGKSILLGALDLLLGGEAAPEMVRAGAERAVAEGLFILTAETRTRLAESVFSGEDPGEELVLRREIASGGRSRSFVNGAMANLQMLRALGEELVQIHGQSDNRLLVRQSQQLELLDAFGALEGRRAGFSRLLARSRQAARRLESLEAARTEFNREQELLRFQLQEIDAAALHAGEDDELQEELSLHENAEKISEALAFILKVLEGDSTGGYGPEEGASPVIDSLDALHRQMEHLTALTQRARPLAEQLDSARYTLDDLVRSLRELAQGLDHDPQRLNDLRARKDMLYMLKKKYGPSLEDVLAHRERVAGRLEQAGRDDSELESLRGETASLQAGLAVLAAELTAARRECAVRMETEVQKKLSGLSMSGARFSVQFEPLEGEDGRPGYLTSGADRVTFLLAANPGTPLLPLSRVASGGELSRVMLAIESVLADTELPSTMIFDEVDSGIGGQVGRAVGEYLASIAGRHQVLVVTHLAQIARCADDHLVVEKTARDGRVETMVRRLSGAERPAEIARMMGGDMDSELSLAHARQMLERQERKNGD